MSLIETDRLLLDPLGLDEARALVTGARAGRAWADDYPTEGDVIVAGLAVASEGVELDDRIGDLGLLQVRTRFDGLAVGGIGFTSRPDVDGAAELGYGFAPSARGKGLATEALEALLAAAAARGLRVAVAHTDAGNLASQRVLERAGFVLAASDDERLRFIRRLDGTGT